MNIDRQAPAVAEHRITIQAPIERVWKLITEVHGWPAWNPAVKKVHLSEPLGVGVTFRWKSGGFGIASTVQAFTAPTFVGWNGRAFGTRAIHTWHLESTTSGVIVTTAESFDGWLVRLMKGAMQKALDAALTSCLSHLKAAAERI